MIKISWETGLVLTIMIKTKIVESDYSGITGEFIINIMRYLTI